MIYSTLCFYSGVPLGEACSIVLRGATEQIIGEAERSLHDALCVLTSTVKETKTTFGGGNNYSNITLASALQISKLLKKVDKMYFDFLNVFL